MAKRPAGMSLEWTTGMTPAEKDAFEKLLRSSPRIVSRLKQICEQWEQAILSQQCKPDSYDTPSWAYKQAHLNGELSRIRKFKDLLSFLN